MTIASSHQPDLVGFEPVEADEVEVWHNDADVVVVGFGLAGTCAALASLEAGGDALIVDRASAPGGTSALSAGHFYLGGGTAVQRATGFTDSAESMYRYLAEVTPEVDTTKLQAYCDGSVALFTWLESHGVVFERTYFAGKDVVQPGTQGLMYTGNERVAPFRDLVPPAPRGHKVAAPGDSGGATLMATLSDEALRLGARSMMDCRVDRLIMSRGRVVGVRTVTFGQRQDIMAGSVVLAAGGYVMNREMVAQHTPRLAGRFAPLGGPHDDGSGILLGQSVGGATAHMQGAFLSAPFYPPESLLRGVIVNRSGKRFVAEDSYHGRIAAHVLEQDEGAAWLIATGDDVGWPELGLVPFVDGWERLDQLADALGIHGPTLAETVGAYDHDAQRGQDSAYGKHPDWLAPLGDGPFAAFDLRPGAASYVGFTLGGLATDVDGRVLDDRSKPIAGLYAVGACASNLAQDCLGYSSGTCLGEAAFFGRRAGEAATEEACWG